MYDKNMSITTLKIDNKFITFLQKANEIIEKICLEMTDTVTLVLCRNKNDSISVYQ